MEGDRSYDYDFSIDSVVDDLQHVITSKEISEAVREEIKKIKDSVSKRSNQIESKMKTEPVLKLKDKLSFVLGVLDVFYSAFILGAYPDFYPSFYTYKAILLLTIRFFIFRARRWHYYLFDFCYFANTLVLLYLHVWPNSGILFQIIFAYSTGPLACAVIAWHNALVFHSIDKITSLFIHMSPGFLIYALKWQALSEESRLKYNTCDGVHFTCDNSFWSFAIIPLIPYTIWQLLYILKTEILSAKRIEERSYVTSLRYFLDSDKKSFIGGLIKKWEGRTSRVLAFVGYQFIYTFITMTPVVFYFHSITLHTALLTFIGVFSAWNGASFYFDVFAEKYQKWLAAASQPKPKQTSK